VETPAVFYTPDANLVPNAPATMFFAVSRGPSTGTPKATAVWQAENGALDTDATVVADAAASGGSVVRVSFATDATLIPRVDSSTLPITGLSAGRYNVLARVKRSVSSDVVKMRYTQWSGGMLPPFYNHPTITLPGAAGAAIVRLATIQVPFGGALREAGYSGKVYTGDETFSIDAQRVSGTGNLDIDYLIWVPADSATLASKFTAVTFTAPALTVWDGVSEVVRQLDSTNIFSGTPLAGEVPTLCTVEGRFPTLLPVGENVVHFLRNIDRGAALGPVRLGHRHDVDERLLLAQVLVPVGRLMSLAVPLTVRIASATSDRHVTRELADLTFGKSVPGGFTTCTMTLARPIDVMQTDLAAYAQVYVYDGRNGATIWTGELEDPGREAGSNGEVWSLAAIGPSGKARKRKRCRWSTSTPGSTSGSRSSYNTKGAVTETGEIDDDVDALYVRANEGSTATTSFIGDWIYLFIRETGQKLARVRANHRSGRADANWTVGIYNRTDRGATPGNADNNAWVTTVGTLGAAVGGTNFTNGQNVTSLRVNRNVSNIAVTADTTWCAIYNVIVRAMLKDKSGADITTGYTDNTVLASEVVADLLGAAPHRVRRRERLRGDHVVRDRAARLPGPGHAGGHPGRPDAARADVLLGGVGADDRRQVPVPVAGVADDPSATRRPSTTGSAPPVGGGPVQPGVRGGRTSGAAHG
jgi:hypothetical protein